MEFVGHSPLVKGKLFLDQEEIGFKLIPFKQNVSHFLFGETRPVRVPQVNDPFISHVKSWTVLL